MTTFTFIIQPWLYCPSTKFNIDQSLLMTTVIGLIINDDESDYRNEIELLVMLSNDNNLILNVDETKELIVDFRKCRNLKNSIRINGSTA